MSTTIEKNEVEQTTPVSKLELLKRKIAEQKEKYSEKFLSDDEFALEIADMVKGNTALSNKQEQEGGRLETPQRAIERAIKNKKAVIQNDISSLNSTLMECQNAITEAEAMETSDEAIQEEIKNAINGLQEEKESIEEKINNLNQDIIKLDEDQNQEFSKLDSYKIDQAKAVDDPYQFAVETAVATRNNLKESLGDKDSNTVRMPDFKNEDKEVYLSSIKEKAKEINEERIFTKKVESAVMGIDYIDNPNYLAQIINGINKKISTELADEKKKEIISTEMVKSSNEGRKIDSQLILNKDKVNFLGYLKEYPQEYQRIQEKISQTRELYESVKKYIEELGDISNKERSLSTLDSEMANTEKFPKIWGTKLSETLLDAVKRDNFKDESMVFSDTKKPDILHMRIWIDGGMASWEKTVDNFNSNLSKTKENIDSKNEFIKGSNDQEKGDAVLKLVNNMYRRFSDENKYPKSYNDDKYKEFYSTASIKQSEKLIAEENKKLEEEKIKLQEKVVLLMDYQKLKEDFKKSKDSNEYQDAASAKYKFDDERKRYENGAQRASDGLRRLSMFSEDYEMNDGKLVVIPEIREKYNRLQTEKRKLKEDLEKIKNDIEAKKEEKKRAEEEASKTSSKLKGMIGMGKKLPNFKEELESLEQKRKGVEKNYNDTLDEYNAVDKIMYSDITKNGYDAKYSVFANKEELKGRMAISEYLNKVQKIAQEHSAIQFPEDQQKIIDEHAILQNTFKEVEEKYKKSFNIKD